MALQCMCSGVYLRCLLRPLWSCIVYSGIDWNLLQPRLNISGSVVFNILSYHWCFLKQACNIPTDVLANRCDLQSLFSHKMLARAERWNWLKEVKQCATPFVHMRGLHPCASVVCYAICHVYIKLVSSLIQFACIVVAPFTWSCHMRAAPMQQPSMTSHFFGVYLKFYLKSVFVTN